ncbi:MAG TPA: hypothetical protein VH142_16680 [Polyangiaceae bacterium]|jgi:hypothetical protein|nr:hypothetical protein [Polyangiaceae bacterium]
MQRGYIMGKKELLFLTALGAFGLAPALAACTGEVVVERPRGCADAVWVHGHHNDYGRWVPGHWVCGRRHVVVVGSAE